MTTALFSSALSFLSVLLLLGTRPGLLSASVSQSGLETMQVRV